MSSARAIGPVMAATAFTGSLWCSWVTGAAASTVKASVAETSSSSANVLSATARTVASTT